MFNGEIPLFFYIVFLKVPLRLPKKMWPLLGPTLP